MDGNVENIARLSSVPQISNSAWNNKFQSKQKRTNDAAGWRWNSCRNDCFNRRTLAARRGIFNWTRPPSQCWNSLFLVFQDCWFSRSVLPLHSEGFQLQPAEGKATLSERCLCISSSPCAMVQWWNCEISSLGSAHRKHLSSSLFDAKDSKHLTRGMPLCVAVKSDMSWKPGNQEPQPRVARHWELRTWHLRGQVSHLAQNWSQDITDIANMARTFKTLKKVCKIQTTTWQSKNIAPKCIKQMPTTNARSACNFDNATAAHQILWVSQPWAPLASKLPTNWSPLWIGVLGISLNL